MIIILTIVNIMLIVNVVILRHQVDRILNDNRKSKAMPPWE